MVKKLLISFGACLITKLKFERKNFRVFLTCEKFLNFNGYYIKDLAFASQLRSRHITKISKYPTVNLFSSEKSRKTWYKIFIESTHLLTCKEFLRFCQTFPKGLKTFTRRQFRALRFLHNSQTPLDPAKKKKRKRNFTL